MEAQTWTSICPDEDLTPDSGLCAWYNQEQVAIFKFGEDQRLYAVSNYDPVGEANVMSRGILGSVGHQLVVTSPLYKQHYHLETGRCLEQDARLKTYAVRTHNGEVQLRARP